MGVALFGAGGVADMAWHLAFGVEVGVDALLSPTHLLLLTGAALMLTAPLRSVWGRPPADGVRLAGELPAVVSLVLVTALAAFFLLYTSVFTGPAAAVGLTAIPEGGAGHEEAELPAVAGLAGYLVTTVLLVVPLLLAQRIGRRPRGTAAVVVGTVAWLSVAVAGFAPAGIAVAVAVTVAGALVDLVQPLVDRSALRPAVRAAVSAALVPALVWPAQLIAVAATVGVRWPVELWSGVVVLSALVAATLGVATSWTPAPDGRVDVPDRNGAPESPAVTTGRPR